MLLTNIQVSQSGTYSVVISNLGGSITSAGAVVLVRPALAQLAGAAFTGDGTLQFQFTGSLGAIYEIQASSNLFNPQWETIAVITNAIGNSTYSDPVTTNFPQRFYRAIAR